MLNGTSNEVRKKGDPGDTSYAAGTTPNRNHVWFSTPGFGSTLIHAGWCAWGTGVYRVPIPDNHVHGKGAAAFAASLFLGQLLSWNVPTQATGLGFHLASIGEDTVLVG